MDDVEKPIQGLFGVVIIDESIVIQSLFRYHTTYKISYRDSYIFFPSVCWPVASQFQLAVPSH
jgi:hypothetical protein